MTGGSSQDNILDLMRRTGATSPEQALEWARRMPQGAPQGGAVLNGMNPPRHVLFGLGSVECALPTEVVQGVERVPPIAPVPNLADWVLGVVQVRGDIVSVVDLRRFFGLQVTPLTQQSRLVVARMREMVISFLVDYVREMRTLAGLGETVERTSVPVWAQLYSHGTISAPDHPIVALDPEALLFGEKMHHYRADML